MTDTWCMFVQGTILTENNIDTHQRCQLSDFALTFQTTLVSTGLLTYELQISHNVQFTTKNIINLFLTMRIYSCRILKINKNKVIKMVPTLHAETNRKNTRPTYAQKTTRQIFCLFFSYVMKQWCAYVTVCKNMINKINNNLDSLHLCLYKVKGI